MSDEPVLGSVPTEDLVWELFARLCLGVVSQVVGRVRPMASDYGIETVDE